MKIKRVLSLVLGLCLIAGLLAGCGGGSDKPSTSTNPGGSSQPSASQGTEPDDTVYEINVSLSFPEVSASGFLKWVDEVTEATNGRLKFNLYYSYSLVALADLVKGLQTGLVDMACIVPYEYPSLFTLNGNVFGLPFLGWKDEASACDIYWEMYKECPELDAEWQNYGLHYLSSYFMPGYNMFMTKAGPMETPADLKGHKVITGAPTVQQLLADNSGAPISSGPTDYYSNMEKGVADSIISHINVLGAFGVCPELVNKAVFFGDEYSGAYMYLMGIVFANSYWDKLPADIQQILTEHADNLGKYMLEADMALTGKFLSALDEKGAEKVILTSEQVQVWADALSSYTETDLQSWEKENSATRTIYNTLLDKIAASK